MTRLGLRMIADSSLFPAYWADICNVLAGASFFAGTAGAVILAAVFAVSIPSAACAATRASPGWIAECISLWHI
jgi:hypothetical protein